MPKPPPALTRPRRSSTLLYMKRVPATEKTHRLATPPHLCIAFSSSSSRPSYRNFKKDICRKAEPCFVAARCAAYSFPAESSRASRVCARLPRLVFGLCACAHLSQGGALLTEFSCSQTLGTFSAFSCLRIASPEAFSGFSRLRICRKAKPCLRVFVCSHCSHFCRFAAKSTKTRGTFSAFSRLRTAFLARFWASRTCARLSRCVFGLCACAHCSLGVFSSFSRVRTASPARFRALRVCALLPPLVFGLCACAHCFPRSFSSFSRLRIASPDTFSAFSRLRTASPARFWASRACARLSPTRFRLSRVCARLPRSVCRKAEPCLRVFLWKTRGLLACAHLSQGGAVLCRSAMRCLQFSYSQTLGLLAFAHGFLSQGGAVLRRSAMRCLRFSCSQTLGLCAGAGGEKYFQFGSDKNKHTVRSFLWQKLRN